ncbi:MAG: T9SS type A sorting domain-containing protein [Bacteroidota bacterium]|nr:T9SS type A sorting domain-containing protein [Bacteroidota bacterium]
MAVYYDGEENGENGGQISIFPNPSTGTITISSPVNFAASEFIIYDISGKTIGKYSLSDHSSTINIDQIAPAMYFYEVRNIKNEGRFGKIVIY